MKVTRKQQEEVDFLVKHFCRIQPGEQDIQDYLLHTVYGKKTLQGKFDSNPLMRGKTSLDRNIKMWREDLVVGLISPKELRDDFDSPYFDKLLDTLLLGITKEYRLETLKRIGYMTVLGITNFPEVLDKWKEGD